MAISRWFNFGTAKQQEDEGPKAVKALTASWYRSPAMSYPLVEEDAGNLKVLAFTYYGWSYGFDGKLAKVPKYQEIPSFDKSANTLFGIQGHVDKLGFIWINMNSDPTSVIAGADDFASIDKQPRLQRFDMDSYCFDQQWEMIGGYNWKTLCYYCPAGHPALNALNDMSKY
ncbi:related to choline monooxygenase [Fusarium torulosum]|uniref:Related to choline monooxygenase n=1 Tax=Fusarium torulosum TaxID=33205 RepID=A0AAE8MAC4_9HYPO|nr:related to choline monooxygenase [Fusarium torulosum]